MRVLITGAAGFLGSHLCDRLLAEGHEVVGLDNFVTGSPDNLAHLAGNERFTFIRKDVSEYIFVPGKLDAVMHFASPASPNPDSPYGYPNLRIQTMKAGALGTHNCLGISRAHCARFLLASTSEIYGDPLEHPQTESYWGHVDPVGPRSMYDEAKRFAEAMTMAYFHAHEVDTHIVRIFNTYGPRMRLDDGRVVPNMVQQAVRGEPLTVYGDGEQTRSFCYIDDCLEGIYRLMRSDYVLPLNLGSDRMVTINQLAEIVSDNAGIQITVNHIPGPQGVRGRNSDNTRLREVLKWEPQLTLEEGLKRTYTWIEKQVARKLGVEQK